MLRGGSDDDWVEWRGWWEMRKMLIFCFSHNNQQQQEQPSPTNYSSESWSNFHFFSCLSSPFSWCGLCFLLNNILLFYFPFTLQHKLTIHSELVRGKTRCSRMSYIDIPFIASPPTKQHLVCVYYDMWMVDEGARTLAKLIALSMVKNFLFSLAGAARVLLAHTTMERQAATTTITESVDGNRKKNAETGEWEKRNQMHVVALEICCFVKIHVFFAFLCLALVLWTNTPSTYTHYVWEAGGRRGE